ncbi:hypothetical protein G4B88_020540, partial [Cannabis sativa]
MTRVNRLFLFYLHKSQTSSLSFSQSQGARELGRDEIFPPSPPLRKKALETAAIPNQIETQNKVRQKVTVSPNLTDLVTVFKQNRNSPDVLIMGSGLWHMLKVTNESDCR